MQAQLVLTAVFFSLVAAKFDDSYESSPVVVHLKDRSHFVIPTQATPREFFADPSIIVLKKKCLENDQTIETILDVLRTQSYFQNKITSFLKKFIFEKGFGMPATMDNSISGFYETCEQMPKLKNFTNDYFSAIHPCLSEKENYNTRYIVNAIDAMSKFVCLEGGTQLALTFLMENQNCLKESIFPIRMCLSEVSYGEYSPEDVENMSIISYLNFEEPECNILHLSSMCFSKQLKTCSDSMPGELAEGLGKLILESTPCSQFKIADTETE